MVKPNSTVRYMNGSIVGQKESDNVQSMSDVGANYDIGWNLPGAVIPAWAYSQ